MGKVKVGLLFLVFFVFSDFVNAQELISLTEVENLIESSPNKEVKAYFKSVERGIEIKRYDVVLRGVLKEPGFNIIVFVTSERIVAGMSGSPVYIGNKLIGAMAYGFNDFAFSDWWWGGIQPIHAMIEQAELGSHQGLRSFKYQGMTFEPIAMGSQTIPGLEQFGGGKFVVTNSSAGQGVSVGASMTKPILEAGRPIVVDLIEWTDEKGEVSTISAMGTITYIDWNTLKIYAFGHPFLESRNVVYSFRTAEVMGTVYSEFGSFKLTGKTSDVLGVITYDASHGISGSAFLDDTNKLHHFQLEFKTEGKPFHNFNIKVADSILTPLLAQVSFAMIGEIYNAPLPQELSVTQIDSRIDLAGYKSVLWKELFASNVFKFGVQTIYISSYRAAYETFFANVYSHLFENDYGLKISNASVSVNFISGRSRTFKLGNYRFPNKVIYSQNPILEILLVDENNSTRLAKKVEIKVDWDKVEKPIYDKNTLDTEKVAEKRVWGSVGIYSSGWFIRLIEQAGGSEKQKFSPDYFLGVDDFLENLSRVLDVNNQKIFLRITLKSKSGLFDEKISEATDLISTEIPNNGTTGWHVIDGGLNKRAETIKDEGIIILYPELPQVLDGFVVDQNLRDGLSFEIVNEK